MVCPNGEKSEGEIRGEKIDPCIFVLLCSSAVRLSRSKFSKLGWGDKKSPSFKSLYWK